MNAPAFKRLMKTEGIAPPIGASPGELRLWLKMNGFADDDGPGRRPLPPKSRRAPPGRRLPPMAVPAVPLNRLPLATIPTGTAGSLRRHPATGSAGSGSTAGSGQGNECAKRGGKPSGLVRARSREQAGAARADGARNGVPARRARGAVPTAAGLSDAEAMEEAVSMEERRPLPHTEVSDVRPARGTASKEEADQVNIAETQAAEVMEEEVAEVVEVVEGTSLLALPSILIADDADGTPTCAASPCECAAKHTDLIAMLSSTSLCLRVRRGADRDSPYIEVASTLENDSPYIEAIALTDLGASASISEDSCDAADGFAATAAPLTMAGLQSPMAELPVSAPLSPASPSRCTQLVDGAGRPDGVALRPSGCDLDAFAPSAAEADLEMRALINGEDEDDDEFGHDDEFEADSEVESEAGGAPEIA